MSNRCDGWNIFYDRNLLLTIAPHTAGAQRLLPSYLRHESIRGILRAGFFPVAIAFFNTADDGARLDHNTAQLCQ